MLVSATYMATTALIAAWTWRRTAVLREYTATGVSMHAHVFSNV
jgi:hypothetical protein